MLRDVLSEGLNFVGAAGPGTYDESTGLWTIGLLGTGETKALILRAQVIGVGIVQNIAQVEFSDQMDPDSTPANSIPEEDDQATAIVATFEEVADLELTKTVNNVTVMLGDQVTFTVTVLNKGSSPATGVVVKDLLPVGLAFVSTTLPETYDESVGLWDVGVLGLDESKTLVVQATVTNTGTLGNTAQVQVSDQVDPDSTPGNSVAGEDDQSSVSVTGHPIPEADLEVTKMVDFSAVALGDQLTFTMTVLNRGGTPATGVVLRESLPEGLVFNNAVGPGTYDEATGLWDIGILGVGETKALVLQAEAAMTGTVENVVQVESSDQADPDSTPGNSLAEEDDQASVTLTTFPELADLELTKTVNTFTPMLGEQVTFTITVLNRGSSPATGVVVKDLLPDGLALDSTTGPGTYDSSTGLWDVDELSVEESKTLVLQAQVTVTGTLENIAQVESSDQVDPDSMPGNSILGEDDQALIIVTTSQEIADLELTKTVDQLAPLVGEEVLFTVTVLNKGSSPATGVVVKDLLPEGLAFVSTTGPGTYDSSTGLWNPDGLDVGEDKTLVLQAQVTITDTLENIAQVESSDQVDPDSRPGNSVAGEDDQASVRVTPSSE